MKARYTFGAAYSCSTALPSLSLLSLFFLSCSSHWHRIEAHIISFLTALDEAALAHCSFIFSPLSVSRFLRPRAPPLLPPLGRVTVNDRLFVPVFFLNRAPGSRSRFPFHAENERNSRRSGALSEKIDSKGVFVFFSFSSFSPFLFLHSRCAG